MSFLIYLKLKPAKYGIKVRFLADLYSCYCWNLEVYIGKGVRAENNHEKRVVLELTDGLPRGNGVVTSIFYTSLSLAIALEERLITLLGTLQKRVEVSKGVIPSKFQKVHFLILL